MHHIAVYFFKKSSLLLVIVGTSGSGLFNAGVGATHPASGGQFWPPEKKPEVAGSRNSDFLPFFFKNQVRFHIIAPGNHFFLRNCHD